MDGSSGNIISAEQQQQMEQQFGIYDADAHPFFFRARNITSVTGNTGSGKSTLIAKILRDRNELIKPSPQAVIYVYNSHQPELFNQITEWCQGTPVKFTTDMFEYQTLVPPNQQQPTVLVLDDQQPAVADSGLKGVRMMTEDCNHRNLKIFYVQQSMYIHSKYNTALNRQAKYCIMFSNRRNPYEEQQLGKECLQLNADQLSVLYKDAGKYTNRPYLVYDNHPDTSEFCRLTTNILATDKPKFFYYPYRQSGGGVSANSGKRGGRGGR